MEVVLGTNKFIDCDTIILLRGAPLLKVQVEPLRLTVVTPSENPSGRHVRVVDNVPGDSSQVLVLANDQFVHIFWERILLVAATVMSPGVVHVHIDLRPVGILCFDDPLGLHIGAMNMATSSFVGAHVAFHLG